MKFVIKMLLVVTIIGLVGCAPVSNAEKQKILDTMVDSCHNIKEVHLAVREFCFTESTYDKLKCAQAMDERKRADEWEKGFWAWIDGGTQQPIVQQNTTVTVNSNAGQYQSNNLGQAGAQLGHAIAQRRENKWKAEIVDAFTSCRND